MRLALRMSEVTNVSFGKLAYLAAVKNQFGKGDYQPNGSTAKIESG